MKKFSKIFTIAAAAIVVVAAIIFMLKGAGLVPGLDFGAGAYYYADIPQFEKFFSGDTTTSFSTLPLWVYIVLFLVWGALMYRLWVWIEKH